MKNLFTSISIGLAALAFQFNAMAQCPGCVIDQTCAVGINPVAPSQCPVVLPNATQGVPYDQDITFYMPRNFNVNTPAYTGAVQLNSITVVSYTGMPQGLNFTCSVPSCSFTVTNNPASERACAKVCGTPTVPGNYVILINVIANVTALSVGVTQNQPSTITIPLTVDQQPGGNCCFNFNPPTACGDLDVTYQALIDLAPNQPTSYQWTFDNGNTSTLKNPPVQHYSQVGQHFPRLVTTVSNYVLTAIDVTVSGTNWCGDIEEPNILTCQGSPDPYYLFTNGSISFQSAYVNNNAHATFNNLHHVLENPIMSVQFLDDDGTSQDDNLGTFAANITAAGTFSFSTSVSGTIQTSGTYTISLETDTVYDTTDTVEVYANPAIPTITSSPNDSVCIGDSILLSTPSGPYSYQWFNIHTLISDSIATYVSLAGYYRVTVVDTLHICSATSDSVFMAFVQYPQAPVITVNTTLNQLEIANNSGNFDVQWYNNGVLIPNATGNALAGQTTAGPYTATFTNSVGCNSESFPFTLCLSGTVIAPPNDTLCCGELQEYLATGFVTSLGYTTAWAITPASFGPINSAQTVAAANAAGYVHLPSTSTSIDFTRVCFNNADSIIDGDYFVTPFIVEDVAIPAPLEWDTLIGCRPHAFMCPVLSGDSGWAMNPMLFTFPDGSQLNVNQVQAFGLDITAPLLAAAYPAGLPCIDLMNIFHGNPNGHWNLSATNVGVGDLHVDVPAFQVINYVDSCPLITANQVYTIDAVSLVIPPGQTGQVDIDIPPIPGGFPSVTSECSGFGDSHLVYFKNCYPNLTCTLHADSVQAVNVTTVGGTNGFADISVAGGTPPYTLTWNTGSHNEDLFGVAAGTYTLAVRDAAGCKDTLRITISEPPTGVAALNNNGIILFQNQPNPADAFTDILFTSPNTDNYEISVSGIEGKVLFSETIKAKSGLNTYRLDTKNLSAGSYLYSVKSKTANATKRMLIVK